MKKLLILPLLLMLTGCENPNRPGSVQPTEQADTTRDYKVRFLFEIDGIRVYRFYDNRTVYFTSAAGNIGYEYQTTQRTGKTTTTQIHHVETICNSNSQD